MFTPVNSQVKFHPLEVLSNLNSIQRDSLSRGLEKGLEKDCFYKILESSFFNRSKEDIQSMTFGQTGALAINYYLQNESIHRIADLFKALVLLEKRDLAVELMGEITFNNPMTDKELFNSSIVKLILPSIFSRFGTLVALEFKKGHLQMLKASEQHKTFSWWLSECTIANFICAFSEPENRKCIEILHQHITLNESIKKSVDELIQDAMNPINYLDQPEDLEGDLYGISAQLLEKPVNSLFSIDELEELIFGEESSQATSEDYLQKEERRAKLSTLIEALKNQFPKLKIAYLSGNLSNEELPSVTLRELILVLKKIKEIDCIHLIEKKISQKKIDIFSESIQMQLTSEIPEPAQEQAHDQTTNWNIGKHLTKHFVEEIKDYLNIYQIKPEFFISAAKNNGVVIDSECSDPIEALIVRNSFTFDQLKEIAMSAIKIQFEKDFNKIVTL